MNGNGVAALRSFAGERIIVDICQEAQVGKIVVINNGKRDCVESWRLFRLVSLVSQPRVMGYCQMHAGLSLTVSELTEGAGLALQNASSAHASER